MKQNVLQPKIDIKKIHRLPMLRTIRTQIVLAIISKHPKTTFTEKL